MPTRINAPTLQQISKLYGMVFRKVSANELHGITANGMASHQTFEGKNKPETFPASYQKNKSRTATRPSSNDIKKPF